MTDVTSDHDDEELLALIASDTRTDYGTKMRELVDAERANGPYRASEVAAAVVNHLRVNDPDLLAGWLDLQAEHVVTDMILRIDRSTRARAARRSLPDAVKKAEASWLEATFAVQGNVRKPLAEMVRPEVLYVAKKRGKAKRSMALQEAFAFAIAKKLPDDVTPIGQVLDADELDSLYRTSRPVDDDA